MAVDLIRLDDRIPDALGKSNCISGLLQLRHDDGKFVTPEPSNGVGFSGAAAQPVGNKFQQFVSDRVSQGIVDAFEMVEVEAQHCQALAAFDTLQFLLKPFTQQDAIWQIGQGVMPRHVSDLLLSLLPIGDVFVGGQPSAAGDRRVDDRDHAIAA